MNDVQVLAILTALLYHKGDYVDETDGFELAARDAAALFRAVVTVAEEEAAEDALLEDSEP